MKTIFLVTANGEYMLGRAASVIVTKKRWGPKSIEIRSAWLVNVRVNRNRWEKKTVSSLNGPPTRYLDISEKIETQKRYKSCVVYTLYSGEKLIVYNESA